MLKLLLDEHIRPPLPTVFAVAAARLSFIAWPNGRTEPISDSPTPSASGKRRRNA